VTRIDFTEQDWERVGRGFQFVLQPKGAEFKNPEDARAFLKTLAEENLSQ
jgi:hypothetical protein